MDSGNIVWLILGIGVLALLAYIVYKNRALKGKINAGPVSAEIESNTALEPTAKIAANNIKTSQITNIATAGSAVVNAAGDITDSSIHNSAGAAGAASVKATIQQFIAPTGSFDSKALRDFIATHFNLEEIASLCADIDVDKDSIPGQSKEAKARELVQFCERRGILAMLTAAVVDARG